MIEATARLRYDHPDLLVHVIGEGPLREQLEAQVADLGIVDHVQFLGRQPHEAVLQRIGGARVFCLPARIAEDGDRDSMPVVIKEAMVRRVRVVGTEVAAVPEMLDDGCGVLVPQDDVASLTEALHLMLTDDQARKAVQDKALRRATDHFTLPGEVRHMRRLIFPGT